MANLKRHLYEFETLGYTIIENVFGTVEVGELKRHLVTALEDDLKRFSGKEGKKPDLAIDLTIHNPIFIKALGNKIMLDFFSSILEKNCVLYSYTSTILRPGVTSGVHSMHVDTNKFIPDYVTGVVMTLALDDFTNENGATLYLPGSHHSTTIPAEETFVKYAQSTARKSGDALFFNPRVYHRAANNKSDKIRYGLTIYATRAFIKPRFDFPRMIPKESLNGLSKELKNFLGFSAQVPESVEQFYLPPEKRFQR